METINFDSLGFTKRLIAHGFTPEQAEALAEEQGNLINSQLATKRDIELIRRDMRELEMRLTIRLGGMLVTGIIVVAALVKLL